MHPLDGVAMLLVRFEVVGDEYPSDHQDLAVLADLTSDVGLELAAACVDPTRLQRAPEGSDQSAPGRRDHVVEGSGMGRQQIGIHPVVLGDL